MENRAYVHDCKETCTERRQTGIQEKVEQGCNEGGAEVLGWVRWTVVHWWAW